MLMATSLWGAGIAGFGLAHSLWVALALAGAADAISVVFRTTMVQLTTPDRQPRYRAASTPGNAWNFHSSGCSLQLHSSAKGVKGAVR
jgi:hypothetical protein